MSINVIIEFLSLSIYIYILIRKKSERDHNKYLGRSKPDHSQHRPTDNE
jgi:hypothetical protein